MAKEKLKTIYAKIDGIYCDRCVRLIKDTLGSINGVERVSVKRNVAYISGSALPSPYEITEAVRKIGYETGPDRISTDKKHVQGSIRWYEFLLIAAVIISVAIIVNRALGYNIFNAIPVIDSSISYGMLFITGLLTGIHCISMCGAIGIFASSESNSVRSIKRPLLYNIGRVVSYTAIGGIVGLAGSAFSVSPVARGIIILAASVLMILMSLSMMGIIRFSLPRFFNINAGNRRYGSFIVGLLNGFMPCGPLQTMQLYALSTGSFVAGAFSMFLFAIGTVPIMLASGALISLTSGKAKIIIGKIASVLMLILAVTMLYRALIPLGIDLADGFQSRYEGYTKTHIEDNIQTAEFDLEYDSYADIIVQKGIPVRITVNAAGDKITGCNNEIISPDFDFDITLREGENIIEFMPADEGEYTYTCWMNMIKNKIKVIDDPDYFTDDQ